MEQNTNITTKVCKDCGRELPIEMFGKHAKTKDGLQPSCRDCRSKKVKGKVLKSRVKNMTEDELLKKIFGEEAVEKMGTKDETRAVIDGEKASKELDAIATRVQRSISSALDQELVDELRARGWTVSCSRTIEL